MRNWMKVCATVGMLVAAGAALGGLCIGLVRAMSDQYIATQWTNSIVFAVLVLILIFRPSGLLGARTREKV